MKPKNVLLALAILFLCGACASLPLLGKGIPPDQGVEGGLYLVKGSCVIRITADLLSASGTEDPTKTWALAIEREFKKAGWKSCSSSRYANIIIRVTGLARQHVPEGNSHWETVRSERRFYRQPFGGQQRRRLRGESCEGGGRSNSGNYCLADHELDYRIGRKKIYRKGESRGKPAKIGNRELD